MAKRHMKQLKLLTLGLSMVIFAGCQTTSHLSPFVEEAQVQAFIKPFSEIKQSVNKPIVCPPF